MQDKLTAAERRALSAACQASGQNFYAYVDDPPRARRLIAAFRAVGG